MTSNHRKALSVAAAMLAAVVSSSCTKSASAECATLRGKLEEAKTLVSDTTSAYGQAATPENEKAMNDASDRETLISQSFAQKRCESE